MDKHNQYMGTEQAKLIVHVPHVGGTIAVYMSCVMTRVKMTTTTTALNIATANLFFPHWQCLLYVVCAREGETGTEESAQVLTQKNWKTTHHLVECRNPTLE